MPVQVTRPQEDVDKDLAAGVKRPKKNVDIKLHGIWGQGVPGRLVPEVFTATGAAAVSLAVLKCVRAGRGGGCWVGLRQPGADIVLPSHAHMPGAPWVVSGGDGGCASCRASLRPAGPCPASRAPRARPWRQ